MNTEQISNPIIRKERFVFSLLSRIQEDKGLAARLRRADNPTTEYQSWETLAGYGIDIESEIERLPFVTIAAALAKAKAQSNGSLRLGQAIAECYKDRNNDDQAKARLRRILACDELPELCRNLRPLLTLIASRVPRPLDYVRLLHQIQVFVFDPQRVKAQWAQEFYSRPTMEDEIK